jgi:hypothetical protein
MPVNLRTKENLLKIAQSQGILDLHNLFVSLAKDDPISICKDLEAISNRYGGSESDQEIEKLREENARVRSNYLKLQEMYDQQGHQLHRRNVAITAIRNVVDLTLFTEID